MPVVEDTCVRFQDKRTRPLRVDVLQQHGNMVACVERPLRVTSVEEIQCPGGEQVRRTRTEVLVPDGGQPYPAQGCRCVPIRLHCELSIEAGLCQSGDGPSGSHVEIERAQA
ncbi:hypothetical protein ASD08_14275 [Streptomyces sp. Root369]|nr:hypothetical protein ASD08_14275 [Streptomyces sp. Root369]